MSGSVRVRILGIGMGAHHVTPEVSRALAAVSYTHLRAHETVLDLVCRLLLEKKTTKNRQACLDL